MERNDFEIPKGLSKKGRVAAETIVAFLKDEGRLHSGGCKVFYTPKEWKERGEEYGLSSLLIVCHDGGDHAGAFNYDYEQYDFMERLRQKLSAVGAFQEQCTGWYSCVCES